MRTNEAIDKELSFKNIRDILENCFPEEKFHHSKGVDRIEDDKTDSFYDINEYNIAINALKDRDYSIYNDDPYLTFPIDKYYDSHSKTTVKLRERFEYYELSFAFLYKQPVKVIMIPKTGCKLMTNWYPTSLYDISHLLEHEITKPFCIALLEHMGQSHYIYRDIARCIKEDGFISIHEELSHVARFRTPNELIHAVTDTELNINFNKRKLNLSYDLVMLSRYIDKRDQGILCSIPEDRLKQWCNKKHGRYELDIYSFIIGYYKEKIGFSETEKFKIHSTTILNYLQERKISLRISSAKRLSSYFEEAIKLAREKREMYNRWGWMLPDEEMTGEIVPKLSRFSTLKDQLPDGFEWITSFERLREEGEKQHNCVFTYWNQIRDDLCAIVHWNRYTIEIIVNDNEKMKIVQMRGVCNSLPQNEDKEYASEVFDKIQCDPRGMLLD